MSIAGVLVVFPSLKVLQRMRDFGLEIDFFGTLIWGKRETAKSQVVHNNSHQLSSLGPEEGLARV
jgi:hypothetical protein